VRFRKKALPDAAGPFYSRVHRGLLSRPTVKEVFHYRSDIDLLISELIESADGQLLAKLEPVIILGLHHEQQHQELMLTDIKSVFWQNPLRPAFRAGNRAKPQPAPAIKWLPFMEDVYWVGYEGPGFSYTLPGFAGLAWRAGFELVRNWEDSNHLFSVIFLRVRGGKPGPKRISPGFERALCKAYGAW
jgi:hypothetical protein